VPVRNFVMSASAQVNSKRDAISHSGFQAIFPTRAVLCATQRSSSRI
jgi:hypothetical protein